MKMKKKVIHKISDISWGFAETWCGLLSTKDNELNIKLTWSNKKTTCKNCLRIIAKGA